MYGIWSILDNLLISLPRLLEPPRPIRRKRRAKKFPKYRADVGRMGRRSRLVEDVGSGSVTVYVHWEPPFVVSGLHRLQDSTRNCIRPFLIWRRDRHRIYDEYSAKRRMPRGQCVHCEFRTNQEIHG